MKNTFTFLLLFLSLSLFSQEFKKAIPATIALKNGVSKSVIISSEDIRNSQSIQYRTLNSDEVQIVTPQEILAITADDNSIIIKPWINPNESYFLNLVVGGASNLYSFIDKTESIKYVAYNEEFGFKILQNNKSSIKKEGREFNQNTKEYLGVLNLIFSDCNNNIDFKNIKLSIASLSDAFVEYNKCKNDLTFTSNSLANKMRFRVGILGGLDFNKINIKTPVAANAKGETNFTVGTELVLIPSFFQSRLNPFLGVNYTKTGGTAEYLSTPEFDALELNFEMVELNVGLRYTLTPLSSKLNPFIGFSLGKSFVLDYKNSILKVSSNNTVASKPLYDGNSHKSLDNSMKLGFHYQAGVNYRLSTSQGIILKADYSSMHESIGEFQFNRLKLEVGYYFSL